MSYKISNSTVMQMTKMNITGNVVPISWFEHLKFNSGKPNLPAIMILSDIIYWYKAQKIRDEETGMVVEYRQKFKYDMLQKQYKLWMELYGFGRTQTKNAVDYLEEEGLINREFRDIELPNGEIAYNRMFVEPVPEKIEEITYPKNSETPGGSFQNQEGVISKSGGGDSKMRGSSFQSEGDVTSKEPGGHFKVNSTENTTETSTESTTDNNNNKFSKSNFKKIKSTYEELIGRKFTDRLNKRFYELSTDVNDIITALERCHDYNINNKGGPPNKYIYKTIKSVSENNNKAEETSNEDFSDWDDGYDDQLIESIKNTYKANFEEKINFIYLDKLARKDYSNDEIVNAITSAAEKYYEYIDNLVNFENKKTPYEFILDELKDITMV